MKRQPSSRSERERLMKAAKAEQLREMQHFAELGRLSASLLHEISNPLTASLLHLEQVDGQRAPHLQNVRRSMLALQRYVEAARQQVRRSSQDITFRVRAELDQVKRVLTPLAKQKGVKLRIQTLANYRLYGDPVKFQQIVSNLVINGIDAYELVPFSPIPKEVVVSIAGQRDWVVLQVSDRGAGIDQSLMPTIFQPFSSTKSSSGKGLGMGLNIVKDYVRNDFGGSIRVASSPQRGTQFTIKFRVTIPSETATKSSSPQSLRALGKTQRIS